MGSNGLEMVKEPSENEVVASRQLQQKLSHSSDLAVGVRLRVGGCSRGTHTRIDRAGSLLFLLCPT